MDKLKILYQRQAGITVVFEGVESGIAFRADIIIENKVIIEFKSLARVEKSAANLPYLLKLSNIKPGLLENCNLPLIKDGIYRKINGCLNE